MHGQLWTFTVRMLKHGKPRSHKTIGHVPFLRARFPVAIIEKHRQVSAIRASWFLGYFRDVFLPGFPLIIPFSRNMHSAQIFFAYGLLRGTLLPMIEENYYPFWYILPLKGTDDQ